MAPIALAFAVLLMVVATGFVMLVPIPVGSALGYRALTFPLQLLGASAAILPLALLARLLKAPLAAHVLYSSSLLAAVLVAWPSFRLFTFAQKHGVELSARSYLSDAQRENYGPPARERSIVYNVAEDGSPLELDVWRSRGASGVRPAIVMVHGGGWTSGNRGEAPLWNEWLNELGYHVFDVDYRLTALDSHREQLGDVKCALGWVMQHAAEYGVDTTRIALFGRSAGANLALLAAYTRGEPKFAPSCDAPLVDIRAVVNLYGPADLTSFYEAGSSYARAVLTTYLGGAPSAVPDRYRAWSPVTHVRPHTPPTLTIFGEADRIVPAAQADLLSRALARFAGPHETYVLPYTDHAFDVNWGGLGTQFTREKIRGFLSRHVGAAPRGPLNRTASP